MDLAEEEEVVDEEVDVKVEAVKLVVVVVDKVYLAPVDVVVCPVEVVNLVEEDRWVVEVEQEDLEVVVLLPMEMEVYREVTSDPDLLVVYPPHRAKVGKSVRPPVVL